MSLEIAQEKRRKSNFEVEVEVRGSSTHRKKLFNFRDKRGKMFGQIQFGTRTCRQAAIEHLNPTLLGLPMNMSTKMLSTRGGMGLGMVLGIGIGMGLGDGDFCRCQTTIS